MSLQVVARFSVIDESADWIVVDKPAPLIVHPANQKPEPTLLGGVEHLLAYEIETTRRRVNVLEYMLIPQLEDAEKEIVMKLTLLEMENTSRLQRVKEIIRQH
jgi:hypothetical protein